MLEQEHQEVTFGTLAGREGEEMASAKVLGWLQGRQHSALLSLLRLGKGWAPLDCIWCVAEMKR